jgi:hypothetical protein
MTIVIDGPNMNTDTDSAQTRNLRRDAFGNLQNNDPDHIAGLQIFLKKLFLSGELNNFRVVHFATSQVR